MNALPCFVGLDLTEVLAANITQMSLLEAANGAVWVQPLLTKSLERAEIYTRTCYRGANGQRYDIGDGKPFSTDFSFSRFLVPALCQWHGWALFCDGDILWRGFDVDELHDLMKPELACLVVKHNHQPPEGTKMRGQVQQAYPRKNWSSVVLWNCGHASNRYLTPRQVNTRAGSWLHGFSWLTDAEIGELPDRYNWLVGHSNEMQYPYGVHYTDGTPDMLNDYSLPYALEWQNYEGIYGIRRRDHGDGLCEESAGNGFTASESAGQKRESSESSVVGWESENHAIGR